MNTMEDLNSELDKFESFLRKDDAALYLQNKVACRAAMNQIELIYGPFDENEVKFYFDALCDGNATITINSFQKNFVFNLFYKFFGDPSTINLINVMDYVKLIIATRRVLEDAGMVLLPHIVSSKVVHLATRKNINKKELQKIEASEYYPLIHKKYNNPKIEQDVILSLIAQILSSEFQIVDYAHPNRNGMTLNIIPDIVSEEVCRFVMLI